MGILISYQAKMSREKELQRRILELETELVVQAQQRIANETKQTRLNRKMKEIGSENADDLHRNSIIADLTRQCSILEAKAKSYSQNIRDFDEEAQEGARKCRRIQNEL